MGDSDGAGEVVGKTYEVNRGHIAEVMLAEARRKREDQETRLSRFRSASAALAAAHVAVSSTLVGFSDDPSTWGLIVVAASVALTAICAAWISSPIGAWEGGANIRSMDDVLYSAALPAREVDRSLALKIGDDVLLNEQLLQTRVRAFRLLLAALLGGYVALISLAA